MMFNEHTLELAIMELFQDEEYIYTNGENISRDISEVLLIDDLRKYLNKRYGNDGITQSETNGIIMKLRSISGTIYEANKTLYKMLCDGFILNREDKAQKDLFINLVDFESPDNNIFRIVNQFEIKGVNNQVRIPDAIVFVNGLPIVVFEFKSAVREDTTIKDAYTQLTVRYKRDIPELFKYNAFVVISDGANNKYGSFFSKYDYFYSWRKIESTDTELDGINSLLTMVKGLFRKNRLLSVVKDFVYFPDSSDRELKIVCRYPQFFAATKLLENIKTHMKPDGDGKGGTYFGATGCGKSYTMLFLTRMLMKSKDLRSPTILVITDRTDLDDQLSKQFLASKKYIGDETVVSIESREKLREELQGRTSGGVYLTTIQKFSEDIKLLTERSNVICISDEAHRSQVNLDRKMKITDDSVHKAYGFAKYLHDSLPNATYVGFTGTPIDATIEVFGAVVDAYTMTESVEDGITVNLVYDGRAAKVILNQEKIQEIERYYDQCAEEGSNEYQIEESKKAVAKLDVIIGDTDRLKAVAEDFINHYETRVAEGATVAGKAMFVCSNRNIAYRFYKIIKELRPEWAEKKVCPDGIELTEREKKELKPIEMIKLVMTRNKDDSPELFTMLGTKDNRKELDRQFKNIHSNFRIAIVVDMWLTGFDVPALDTIYIDKPVQQHTLIQTISRVNRVCEGKEKGLIVDYIGIKKNMNLALRKYTNFECDEFEEIEQSINIVKDQLDVINQMLHNFNSKDFFEGSPKEQLDCINRAVEYVQLSSEIETRFMAAVRRLKQAFNLCSSSYEFSDKERDYIHFYCAVRSVLFKLTKGEAPDISQMNVRVRELLEGAIQSDGIEELFESGKHMEIDIFSEEYLNRINSIQLPNTKIKILQRLLSQAIDEFKKINKIKGVEFSERLKQIVDEYNNRRRDEAYANEVLNDIAEQLANLLSELKNEKDSFKDMGIDFEEKAFYDILSSVAKKYEFKYPDDKMIELSKKIKLIVDDKARYTDWATREDIKANLQVDLILLLDEFDYPPVTIDDVYKEVLEQAENFKKYSK
ncbi:MAG: type I restriction endonuclease subunit R [Muribaculaceae bacterium]|nr:type I restriction endonuclease subunit R [Alistipes senegalensis]MCM1473819.1 type I restriction endonuclease subunit R [Muribaculaceae bacterium]